MWEQLTQINLGELLTAASLAAVAVVTLVTQWLKYIPVDWTSKYPVYINIALSLLGTLVVSGWPSFDTWIAFIVQWGLIALTAAIAYKNLLKPAGTKPHGNTSGDL